MTRTRTGYQSGSRGFYDGLIIVRSLLIFHSVPPLRPVSAAVLRVRAESTLLVMVVRTAVRLWDFFAPSEPGLSLRQCSVYEVKLLEIENGRAPFHEARIFILVAARNKGCLR